MKLRIMSELFDRDYGSPFELGDGGNIDMRFTLKNGDEYRMGFMPVEDGVVSVETQHEQYGYAPPSAIDDDRKPDHAGSVEFFSRMLDGVRRYAQQHPEVQQFRFDPQYEALGKIYMRMGTRLRMPGWRVERRGSSMSFVR